MGRDTLELVVVWILTLVVAFVLGLVAPCTNCSTTDYGNYVQ